MCSGPGFAGNKPFVVNLVNLIELDLRLVESRDDWKNVHSGSLINDWSF